MLPVWEGLKTLPYEGALYLCRSGHSGVGSRRERRISSKTSDA